MSISNSTKVMEKVKISKEKLAELEKELASAITERAAIVERVATARELGDLKENSEYHTARDEQRMNAIRIEEIEGILKNYEIVDSSASENVEVGSTVALTGGKLKSLTVVSSVEADPMNGKVSDESPIGQVLLGKKKGDEVEIAGSKYKISEVS